MSLASALGPNSSEPAFASLVAFTRHQISGFPSAAPPLCHLPVPSVGTSSLPLRVLVMRLDLTTWMIQDDLLASSTNPPRSTVWIFQETTGRMCAARDGSTWDRTMVGCRPEKKKPHRAMRWPSRAERGPS